MELRKEVNSRGEISWVLYDPVSTTVHLRTTNAWLAQECLADLKQYGYIKLENTK